MSDAGEIVGMVDVLKLTYATLDQVRPWEKIRATYADANRSTILARQTAKVRPGTSFGCLLTPKLSQ